MTHSDPLSANAQESQRRVDRAHSSSPEDDRVTAPPPLDLLQAIAGRDREMAPQQLQGQATELAAMLREKHRSLEQRESELNARTALLERDLRQVRLKRQERRQPDEPSPSDAIEKESPLKLVSDTADRHVAAQQSDETAPQTSTRQHKDNAPPSSPIQDRQDTSLPPGNAAELHREWEEIEEQRKAIRLREERLRERQNNVEQLHAEVTDVHRQALELRLATEFVWESLNEDFPGQDHGNAIDQAREQVADHYRMANDAITRRKKQLQVFESELSQQEQRLRRQRREVQMWVDRRCDELEARAAKLAVREREIDQMEHEYQRQSMQWEQQREAYRKEIESLSWKIQGQSDASQTSRTAS